MSWLTDLLRIAPLVPPVAGMGMGALANAAGAAPLGGTAALDAMKLSEALPSATATPTTGALGGVNLSAANLPSGAYSPVVPGAPTRPGDVSGDLKKAHGLLTFTSKLIPGKSAKQTLNLMRLGAGLGATKGDLSSPEAQSMVLDPLSRLADSMQQDVPDPAVTPPRRRSPKPYPGPSILAPSLPPLSLSAAASGQPTFGPVINSAVAPATAAASAMGLPATRSVPDIATLTPAERLKQVWGGY